MSGLCHSDDHFLKIVHHFKLRSALFRVPPKKNVEAIVEEIAPSSPPFLVAMEHIYESSIFHLM
jgi:hypothetical protein